MANEPKDSLRPRGIYREPTPPEGTVVPSRLRRPRGGKRKTNPRGRAGAAHRRSSGPREARGATPVSGNRRAARRRRGRRANTHGRWVARWRGVRGLAALLRRSFRWWLGAGLVAAAALGTVSLAQMAEAHVRSAPTFSTRDIEIEGAVLLERDEILERAGLNVGENVFNVAPEEAQALLVAHPWIAEATVTRQLPGSFSIIIREHRAVALLALDSLYLVSDDGSVFKRMDQSDAVDLPVVSGVDRARFVRDLQYRTAMLTRVVALMHDYRGAGLWRREPISEIHVERDDGLSLYVGDDNMWVRLGTGPYRAKLMRLRRVLERLKRQETRAEYVHLDNVRRPERVTVRLR